MKRLPLALCLAAAAALCLAATPALADVSSTMQTASQNLIQWVRVGGLIVFTVAGLALLRGAQSIWFFGLAIIGISIAVMPEQIMAWIA